jgi:fibronectin type 3 domain-containing protein
VRRAVVPLILAFVLGAALAVSMGASAASTCRTSSPSSGSYSVTVCVGLASHSTLSGREQISMTASATGGQAISAVELSLSGTYVITDWEAPYQIDLPTRLWVDGSYTIQVDAIVDATGWTSATTNVPVTFSNGITSPPGVPSTFTPPSVPDPSPGTPLTVAAVGDGASGEATSDAVADEIASWNPDLFLYLGDVYRDGTQTEFLNWYDDLGGRFGQLLGVTAPTPGNHEYQTPGAQGYYDFWNNAPRYYSFDAGGWHFISLNSNQVAGVGNSSAQYAWLKSDLANDTSACTLAFFHHPRYSVGAYSPGLPFVQPFWSLLANNGVDLVVNGHDHDYQRWKAMDSGGASDPNGTREMIVGTGGHEAYNITHTNPRAVFASRVTQGGALQLQLYPGRATTQFVRTDGAVLDTSSFRCSGSDQTPPSVPQGLTATPQGATHVNLDWSASTDDVGVTGYNVYRDGVQIDSVAAPQTAYSDPSVQASTTYTYKVTAFDAAGNESAKSSGAKATTSGPPDTQDPSVPQDVAAVALDSTDAKVTWSASTDNVGVTAYNIYRDGTRTDSVGGTKLTYTDPNVQAGSTHTYKVTAQDAAGNESAKSAGASVTMPMPGDVQAPTVPKNVAATVQDSFHVKVTWSASTDNVGVAGYDVYRGGVRVAANLTGTSYTDATVEPGTSATYTVLAKDAAGNASAQSSGASASVPGFRFWDGFESGNLSKWTSSQGLTVGTGSSTHGIYSARASSTGTPTYGVKQFSKARKTLYAEAAFRINSKSASNGIDLVRLRTSAGTPIATAIVNIAGNLGVNDDVNGVAIGSKTAVSQGVWHTVQLKVTIAGAKSTTAVWFDGAQVGQLSLTRNLGTTAIKQLLVGDARGGRTYDVRFDDVAMDTSSISLSG